MEKKAYEVSFYGIRQGTYYGYTAADAVDQAAKYFADGRYGYTDYYHMINKEKEFPAATVKEVPMPKVRESKPLPKDSVTCELYDDLLKKEDEQEMPEIEYTADDAVKILEELVQHKRGSHVRPYKSVEDIIKDIEKILESIYKR